MDTNDNFISDWIGTTLVAALMVKHGVGCDAKLLEKIAQEEISKITAGLGTSPAATLMRPTILRAAAIINETA